MKHDENKLNSTAIYAAGFFQGWLTAFAHSESIPTALLSDRVVEFLQSTRPRSESEVREMPHITPELLYHLPEMEMGSHARSYVQRPTNAKRAGKDKRKKKKAAGVKAYWDKMTPKQRTEEMLRRAAVRKKKGERSSIK